MITAIIVKIEKQKIKVFLINYDKFGFNDIVLMMIKNNDTGNSTPLVILLDFTNKS